MNKLQRRLLPAVALLVSGGVLIPDSALLAQGLEEIVVTARKKEENLMEVPVAITAFSSAELQARDMDDLTDIQLYTPSFSFTNMQGGSARNDRSSNSLQFRGLSLSLNTGITAGGALFIDGAPVIGGFSPSVFDTERVEILKGPQSAYFGRSTFVGALNFIMKEPGDEFGATISLDAARYGSHEANVSIEGPLVEGKLAGRLSYRNWEQGGYVNNWNPVPIPGSPSATGVVNNELGERTTQSFAGSLVWTPTDNLKFKAFINYFEDDDGPSATFALKQESFNGRGNPAGGCDPLNSPLPPGATTGGMPAGPTDRWVLGSTCGTLPTVSQARGIDPRIFSMDTMLDPIASNTLFNPNPAWLVFSPTTESGVGLNREGLQASLRIDWDFGDGYTLTSLTAYHEDQSENIIDLNYRSGAGRVNTAFGFCAFVNPSNTMGPAGCRPDWNFHMMIQGDQEDFSQELRLTSPQDRRFRWTAGINYFDAHSPGGSVYGNTPLGPFFTAAITERDVGTPSVFAAGYFDITDLLTLTVEGRYQKDEIDENVILKSNQQPPAPDEKFLSATFNTFAPRISLDYKYADNSTAYILFSRGFRPGRFNNSLVGQDPTVLALLQAAAPGAGILIREEQLDNYEFGVKSTWLDGRARTTVAFFYDEWTDGQVANSIPVVVGTTANLIGVTLNNGLATLKGIEFEGQWSATDNLTLSGSFGLNDTEIEQYQCGDCVTTWGSNDGAVGNELPRTPRITYSLSAQYEDQVSFGGFGDWDWFARADLAHQGSRWTSYANTAKTSAYDNLNLRLGVRNGNLSVETYMLNALDHDEFIGAVRGSIDPWTFTGFGGPDLNEVRVSAPIPRRWGVRASYQF